MNGRLVLVVSLWLKDSNVSRFEIFEREAARNLAKHGGRIERAIRLGGHSLGADHPFEVHIVSFPDKAAFLAYQDDPDVRALASRRGEVISKTTVFMGQDVEVYAEPDPARPGMQPMCGDAHA